MHLKYCYFKASDCDENGHAQKVMKKLGISYQHCTPQFMGCQFWFWNCENVPDILPEYITELDADPIETIDYGLSKEKANEIINYKLKL